MNAGKNNLEYEVIVHLVDPIRSTSISTYLMPWKMVVLLTKRF